MRRKTTAEHQLISKIVLERDMTTALDANLAARYFRQDDTQEAWNWLSAYRTEYGEVATLEAFRRKFPNFPFAQSVADPFKALIDEVYAQYRQAITAEGLRQAITTYDESNDVDETLPIIHEMLRTIAIDTGRSDVRVSSDIIGDLVVKYVNKEEDEMPGIPTGFQLLDEALGGLQDEQLITIVGLPKRMKSSYLLAIGMSAASHGYRVGLVSFEMSNTEQEARWLSLGAGVNLTRMQRGLLSSKEKNLLFEFEEVISDAGFGDLLFIHDVAGASTVDGLIAKQDQHRFDLLLIDGLYLMEDQLGEPKGSSQALTNITRGVKRFAQVAKIPIVCTTQALHSRTSKTQGIQMESIAYTSSFAQDSDVLIGIDRLDMNEPISRLKVVAARNALGMECEVAIDYTKGKIEDRGYVTSDFGGKGGVDGIKYGDDS